jgi:antibiotic biosynthesis monooxygenase (ABM) superfamily enzyme
LRYADPAVYPGAVATINDPDSATPSWRISLVTTLAAWLVAFVIVTALFEVFGAQLASLPLAARTLVISGVLVTVMMRLVLPVLSGAVRQWLAGSDGRQEPSMKEADNDRQVHNPPLRSAR